LAAQISEVSAGCEQRSAVWKSTQFLRRICLPCHTALRQSGCFSGTWCPTVSRPAVGGPRRFGRRLNRVSVLTITPTGGRGARPCRKLSMAGGGARSSSAEGAARRSDPSAHGAAWLVHTLGVGLKPRSRLADFRQSDCRVMWLWKPPSRSPSGRALWSRRPRSWISLRPAHDQYKNVLCKEGPRMEEPKSPPPPPPRPSFIFELQTLTRFYRPGVADEFLVRPPNTSPGADVRLLAKRISADVIAPPYDVGGKPVVISASNRRRGGAVRNAPPSTERAAQMPISCAYCDQYQRDVTIPGVFDREDGADALEGAAGSSRSWRRSGQ